ncbi:Uncharacterised protein, partial [uncultured Comamonas sp.]
MYPYSLSSFPKARTAVQSAAVLCATLLASAAHAQTVPDAGSLQREAERTLQAPPGSTPAPQ